MTPVMTARGAASAIFAGLTLGHDVAGPLLAVILVIGVLLFGRKLPDIGPLNPIPD